MPGRVTVIEPESRSATPGRTPVLDAFGKPAGIPATLPGLAGADVGAGARVVVAEEVGAAVVGAGAVVGGVLGLGAAVEVGLGALVGRTVGGESDPCPPWGTKETSTKKSIP